MKGNVCKFLRVQGNILNSTVIKNQAMCSKNKSIIYLSCLGPIDNFNVF